MSPKRETLPSDRKASAVVAVSPPLYKGRWETGTLGRILNAMRLSDRLSRLLDGLPEGASVTIQAESIQGWLDEAESESDPPDKPVVASLEDHLLTVDEAAGVLAVERTWLYRHADKLPFTRKLSAGTLRFSSSGLQRWLASRR